MLLYYTTFFQKNQQQLLYGTIIQIITVTFVYIFYCKNRYFKVQLSYQINQNTNPKHLDNSIDFTLSGKSAIMIVTYINCINQKGGDNMEVMEDMNNAEIMKNAMDEFEMIQRYMVLAKKEKATETYAELKNRYLLLKALLNSLGVNLIEIDKIKE